MSRSALRELEHLRSLLDQPLGAISSAKPGAPHKSAEALLQEAQVRCSSAWLHGGVAACLIWLCCAGQRAAYLAGGGGL